jgi:hypothetical protein
MGEKQSEAKQDRVGKSLEAVTSLLKPNECKKAIWPHVYTTKWKQGKGLILISGKDFLLLKEKG